MVGRGIWKVSRMGERVIRPGSNEERRSDEESVSAEGKKALRGAPLTPPSRRSPGPPFLPQTPSLHLGAERRKDGGAVGEHGNTHQSTEGRARESGVGVKGERAEEWWEGTASAHESPEGRGPGRAG